MKRRREGAEPPKAYDRALGLLVRREHSARELERKLKSKGYEAADGSIGVAAFTARAQELADKYGSRFAPPALLLEKAAKGENFA